MKYRVDWPFIVRKGLGNTVRDVLLPKHLPRTSEYEGLKWYHWKALPPQNLKHLLPNFETYDILLRQKGNVALDIGAHIGSYALRLARNFRYVYAFEPNPDTFHLLQLNVKRNHLSNVEPLKLAVSDSSGITVLRIPSKAVYGSTINPTHYDYLNFDHEVEATKVSLDDYFHQGEHGHIGLVKIDVEGHELAVLKGMQRIIRKHHPLLSVEVHREPETSHSCSCEVCDWLRERYSVIRGKYPVGLMVHWMICYP